MPNSTVIGSALPTNAVGLHARPSVKLTQLAKSFVSASVDCARCERALGRRQEPGQGHAREGVARFRPSTSAREARTRGRSAPPSCSLVERRFDERRAAAAGDAHHDRTITPGTACGAWHGSGPVIRLDHARLRGGFPPAILRAEPDALLRGNSAQALDALSGLMRDSEREAADILGFQVALSGRRRTRPPAFEAIAEGAAGDTRLAQALDSEIAGYRQARMIISGLARRTCEDLRDRVLLALHWPATRRATTPPEQWLSADDMPPSRFLSIDWSQGGAIVLLQGQRRPAMSRCWRAHAGVPMVVGLGRSIGGVWTGARGRSTGRVILDPDRAASPPFRSDCGGRSASGAGCRASCSTSRPLTRTARRLPSTSTLRIRRTEDRRSGPLRRHRPRTHRVPVPRQGSACRTRRRSSASTDHRGVGGRRPVTIRTLDAGGDKPIPGLTPDGESNPFLGVRGIRLSLAHPDVFRVQLRALAASSRLRSHQDHAAHGDRSRRARAARVTLVDEEYASLKAAGR